MTGIDPEAAARFSRHRWQIMPHFGHWPMPVRRSQEVDFLPFPIFRPAMPAPAETRFVFSFIEMSPYTSHQARNCAKNWLMKVQ